jgi:hypothetical protein
VIYLWHSSLSRVHESAWWPRSDMTPRRRLGPVPYMLSGDVRLQARSKRTKIRQPQCNHEYLRLVPSSTVIVNIFVAVYCRYNATRYNSTFDIEFL